VPYLSASAVVIHYEEALYHVYGSSPLPLPLTVKYTVDMSRAYSHGHCSSHERQRKREKVSEIEGEEQHLKLIVLPVTLSRGHLTTDEWTQDRFGSILSLSITS